ncbi:MAG TPA: hypothetical protein VII78_11465 [Myxococcota bacterium]|jgi:hypothetical protein
MTRKLMIALGVLCLAYVVALSACTSLSRHTVAPYDSDPAEAAKIERAAADWCAEHGYPGGRPPLPFRFDGCSWWPDGFGETDWRPCCQAHDYAYWCGGSALDREAADDALGACVAEDTNAAFGWLMRSGVRAGGHPFLPLYFRWGNGHPYAGGYPEPEATAP